LEECKVKPHNQAELVAGMKLPGAPLMLTNARNTYYTFRRLLLNLSKYKEMQLPVVKFNALPKFFYG
jgi:hypothetical protein